MKSEFKCEVFSQDQCELGEGPLWDHRNRRLYWVDILQCKIHFKDEQSSLFNSISTQSRVGCVGLTEDVDVLLTAQKEGIWLSLIHI